MEKIKGSAVSLLNTQYNKAVYSCVVGAAVDFLYGLLSEFGVDVSAGLQTKTLILAMALTALLVKNRDRVDKEAVNEP